MHSNALFIGFFICLGLVVPSLQQCNNTFPFTLNTTSNIKASLPQRLKIALLGSFTASDFLVLRAFTHELNNNPDILPDVGIDLYTTPAPLASTSDALLGSLFYCTNIKVHGLIGGYTSIEARTIQLAAKIYSVPQATPNSLSYTLSNKDEYPYLMRLIPPDLYQIDGIVVLFQKLGWKKAIVVYTNDDYGSGNARLVVAGASKNITFYPVSVPSTATNASQVAECVSTVVQAIRSFDYRIIVIYTQSVVGNLVRTGLNQSGIIGPEFVTILTAPLTAGFMTQTTTNLLNDGAIGFAIARPSGAVFNSLVAAWKSSTTNPFPYPTNSTVATNSFYTLDSLLNFVYSVDKLLKDGYAFSSIVGNLLYKTISANNNFTGATGIFSFDKNGDRLGNYDIWNFGTRNGSIVAQYSALTMNITTYAPFVFAGGSTTVPRDSPFRCQSCQHGTCVVDVGCVCNAGYSGVSCDVASESSTSMLAWIIAVSVVMVVGFAAGYYVYRRKRNQLVKEVVDKQRSNIARSDLHMKDRIGRGASGEVYRANFRGTEVAVKKIVTANADKAVVEEFELEVAIMCGLRHPNIILFMGSCFDPVEKEMLLVMEFMTRGSLHDVIHNPKIELNYEMKVHLACQAAQGMNFLHQSTPPIIHRDLKSHNILLDDKWNARISDFGITKFKDTEKNTKSTHEKSIGTIYWSAPESLDGSVCTEKADCYSFGIVLWEVFHRQNPYQGRDPVAVAIEVIHNNLRPPMSPDVPTEMKDLICACWQQDPEKRPSFQDIVTTLRSMSMKNPTYSLGASVRVDAPSGHVYLVSTEVVGAFRLWEEKPKAMCEAMKLHNGLIRNNMEMYRGYESQYELHSFLIAFATLEEAMNFCIATQISLLHVNWPHELLSTPLCEAVYNSAGNPLWKGLRVKIAINSGVPNCELDSSSNRMLYMGPVVEKTEKILRTTNKGSIIAADVVVEEITKKSARFIQPITTHKCGEVSTARDAHSAIHRIIVGSLAEREAGGSAPSSQVHPHVLVDVEEIEMPESANRKGDSVIPNQVSWLAHYDEIDMKETVGKGAIGDYYRAYWKSKEVAVKILVNQKLKEDDLLRLLSDASYMSVLTHQNILSFYAVCLDSNHLCMISEFMHRGNLKAILADSSIQLPMSRRVRIAQDIAQGMSFLTTLPDPDMQKHDNLKSNNILIGKDWEVKIADYGQSNIKDLARTMTSVGSVAWTAPEILTGEAQSTPKIATYSFGIILWELLTRQIPYTGEHPIRVVTKILGGYRPPIPGGTPPLWAELIAECLEGDPEDRPSWDSIISKLGSLAKVIN